MPRSNILVVIIDGLRASALGAYGNTTFPAPALDRFAAESFLLDECFAPTADLAGIYRALWQSQHPARVDAPRQSLSELLHAAGYQMQLVTDEPRLVALPGAELFDECLQLDAQSGGHRPGKRALDIAETQLAQFCAAVGETVKQAVNRPRFVWAHAIGMYGAWDAPLALQQSLLDEGDPPTIESSEPPDFVLPPNDGADEAFRYASTYNAQVMALDDCWGSLLDGVDAAETDAEWLVVLVGTRGYPLGEHSRIGGVDSRLYAEQLHTPCLIRLPDRSGRLARSDALTSHFDLGPTLLEWIECDAHISRAWGDGQSILPLVKSHVASWRSQLLSSSADGAYSYRTSDWCLRVEPERPERALVAELYVRPDDRWEANDVARLCPDVVDELRAEAKSEILRLRSSDC